VADAALVLDHSPTDLFQEPACSFCGASVIRCHVLVANDTKTAFICEICAPIVVAQQRDILKMTEVG
jgi:hypothetical protein